MSVKANTAGLSVAGPIQYQDWEDGNQCLSKYTALSLTASTKNISVDATSKMTLFATALLSDSGGGLNPASVQMQCTLDLSDAAYNSGYTESQSYRLVCTSTSALGAKDCSLQVGVGFMDKTITPVSLVWQTNSALRTLSCVTSSGQTPYKANLVEQKTAQGFKRYVLSNINGQDQTIVAKVDPSDLSPQTGVRFYFHYGNSSDFLLLSTGLDDLGAALLNKNTTTISGSEIFEGYEQGGFQDITALTCTLQ